MKKFTLLVAVLANLATSYGSEYSDNLWGLMEGAGVKVSYSECQSEERIDDCSAVTDYSYDDVEKKLSEPTSLLLRLSVEHLTSEYGEKSQLSSAKALLYHLTEINEYATESLCSELYTITNLNNSKEARCFLPTLRDVVLTSGESFLFGTFYYTDENVLREYVQKCYSFLLDGNMIVVDYNSTETMAVGMNKWFAKQSSNSANVVYADDLTDTAGIIKGTYHDIEISCDQFTFYEQTEIKFIKSETLTVQEPAWVGEGRALVAYNERFMTLVIGLYLQDGLALIMKPEPGYENMQKLLTDLLYVDDIMELVAEGSDKYIRLTIPVNENYYGSEDYAKTLKSRNLLSSMFDPNTPYLPNVLFDGGNVHLANMFNKVHLKVNCFGADSGNSSETFEPKEEYTIDSPFTYMILKGSSKTPSCMGTWFGTE